MEGALGSGSCGVGAPYAERVLVGLVALARPVRSRFMTAGISGLRSSRRAQEPITSAHVSHAARCVAPSGGGGRGPRLVYVAPTTSPFEVGDAGNGYSTLL